MSNYLLVVGIDTYTDHPKLNSCVKDVTDFRDILHEKFEFEPENTFELLNDDATNLNIQNSLKNLSGIADASDSLVVYYSGHGIFDESTKRGFWIPYDGNSDYTSWLPNETLLCLLENLNCRHIFVISDSCFSSSILLSSIPKSSKVYANKPSRWALVSAFNQSYDSLSNTINSEFASSILSFLNDTSEHFRLTTLIEHVKSSFEYNVVQTPQGSPLKLAAHKSGEFVFKLKESYELRNLKGFKRFANVLKLYKRNTPFVEVESFENKSKKIGYRLFYEEDKVLKSVTYYLYLFEGCNQSSTKNHLLLQHPKIFEARNLIIFIPKQIGKQKYEVIKSNIIDKFSPLNAFYIDEFVRDQCSPIMLEDRMKNEDYLQISNFILPTFIGHTEDSNVDVFFLKWIKSEVQPILVIKGTGGVGKTTFAHHLIDLYQKINSDLTTLYIDSIKIKDELLKRYSDFNQLTIYNFYEALYEQSDKSYDKLNEELFKLNVDIGNILIVIDGLDEVISKLSNFNVNSFLQSIIEVSSDLGGAKVIITCRSHFWNKEVINRKHINELELNPFNKVQTTEFFEKTFAKSTQIKKALRLSEEFKLTDRDRVDIYQPYVLDVIRSIVESEVNAKDESFQFQNSKYLDTSIHNEYIIYRVCERERIRVGQISVDEQIRFFQYLAVHKRGFISIENLGSVIQEALGYDIDDVQVKAFLSHLFLQKSVTFVGFRYDFLTNIFKSIYLSRYFDFSSGYEKLDQHSFDIISENCWFGSGFLNDLVRRISCWNDDTRLIFSDLIDQTRDFPFASEMYRRKNIAHLFNIALLASHRFCANTTESNTQLLLDLFQSGDNVITNLCIMNLNSDKNVRFDFSDLQIIGAWIDNFGSFAKCKYNDNTKFQECRISNIPVKNIRFKFPKKLFINCAYDSSLELALQEMEYDLREKEEKILRFIYDFLHLFYSNGILGRQWEDKVIKPRFNGIDKLKFGYKKTIEVLMDRHLIYFEKEIGRNKMAIVSDKKESVIRFVKDGTITPVIRRVLSDFTK